RLFPAALVRCPAARVVQAAAPSRADALAAGEAGMARSVGAAELGFVTVRYAAARHADSDLALEGAAEERTAVTRSACATWIVDSAAVARRRGTRRSNRPLAAAKHERECEDDTALHKH